MSELILYFFLAYLLGSIPTAYWAGKVLRGIDIRQHGSRNVGATNAYRVLGPRIGISVLVLDILKGFLAVKLGHWLGAPAWAPVVAGLIAVAGHNWTVFLSFKGGKGVASSAGVFLALVPWAFAAAALSFVLVVATTRYVSAGSITGAIILSLIVILEYATGFGDDPQPFVVIVSCIASIFVIVRHHSNIRRLIQGTENRFSF